MDRELARVRALFDEVLLTSPEDRPALLAVRCGSDSILKRRVEALVATAESEDPFLSQPTRTETSTAAAPALSERPGVRIGPYKLLQQIGEGGFGVVFMAEQDQPVRRRVALKIIKLGMDTRQVVARFEQERQALALMDHPNIAKVLDAGATDSGRPYFVMEYVKGDPITEFADAHRLNVPDRLQLFAQVCAAVQHAHTKGVVHRDLKPRNVLVNMTDGKPFAKVIDFGIAKATGARLTEKTLFTEHRQLIGTPEYMSPEQAEGSPDIDTRTDVYSLGVLLYELLTGATPFDAERLRSAAFAEMQRIIKEEEPVAPSVRLSRSLGTLAATASARQAEPANLGVLVKGDLDWIVMKALDKDRARRYESPSQLAADVQRHLSGEPVAAAPPTAAYRMRKFVRRHKGRVIAAGTLAATLVLGTITTSIGFVLEAKQRRTAEGAQIAEREQRVAAQRATADAEASRRLEAEARSDADAQREAAEKSAYVANLFAAASDPYSARQRLDACPEHLRGWEWRYMNAATDASLRAFAAPEGEQWTTRRFTQDGTRIVLMAATGEARVYETTTGRLLTTMNTGERAGETSLSPDGEHILINAPRRWTVWSLTEQRLITEFPQADSSAESFGFSPDGDRILLSTQKGPVEVFDARSGALLVRLPAYTWTTYSAEFTWDGTHVLTTGAEKVGDGSQQCADLWDATSGAHLLRIRHSDLWHATMSPDGSCIATSGTDSVFNLWNAQTGELMHTLALPAAGYCVPRFSRDGRLLYAAPYYGSGRVWEVATGQVITDLVDHKYSGVFMGNFSPDGTTIVSGAGPNVVLWEVATGRQLTSLAGHTEHSVDPCFNPDGARILSTAWGDGYARLWDPMTPPNPRIIEDVARVWGSSFDGETILCAEWDASRVRLRDVHAGKTLIEWSHPESPGFQESGDTLKFAGVMLGGRAVTVRGWSARTWDTATGHPLLEIQLPTPTENPTEDRNWYPVRCGMDRDGRSLLTAFGNGSVWVTDLATGNRTFDRTATGYPCAAISPDGLRIAAAWEDHVIRVFDLATGRETVSLGGHAATLMDIKFDPTGSRLATMAKDGTMRVWNIESGDAVSTVHLPTGWEENELWYGLGDFDAEGRRVVLLLNNVAEVHDTSIGTCLARLRGHGWWIDRAVFTPDGSRVATASGDRTVRIWETTSGQELAIMRIETANEEGFQGLAFSTDSTRLATCTDRAVYVFDTVPHRERVER